MANLIVSAKALGWQSLLYSPRGDKRLIIYCGLPVLVRAHRLAEALDEVRGPITPIAECAHERVLIEQFALRASCFGNPVGVKQNGIARLKLHHCFVEGLRCVNPQRIAHDPTEGENGAVRCTLQQRRRMAGDGVGEPPCRRVIGAEERRKEAANVLAAKLAAGHPHRPAGLR